MAAMISHNPFGAHGDIMGASPEDDEGKATLCEEIKNRARAEFGRKNLPQAEMLYSKGLEIKPEDATLHSNLAAVRLGLNKNEAALKNSLEAVRLDPAYAKGHYRQGQALMALKRPGEAVYAFRAGAALEPESKLWAPLVQKALTLRGSEVVADISEPLPAKTVVAASTTKSQKSVRVGKTPTSSVVSSSAGGGGDKEAGGAGQGGGGGGEGVAGENGGGAGGGEGMKGYKKTADGRVTTYFNNDLTEEAKALIGDIAPKRLDAAGDVGDGAAGSDVSVWNKAGTWESRDMTSWAKQRLKELLVGVEFDASEGVVEVVTLDKIEGDAEISFSRGKKRCLFDFRIELKWEASDLECGPTKGMLVYPDFGQDCDGTYDVECRVDSSSPTAAKAFVDRHVRAEGSGLREAVLARLVTFTLEFNAK